MSKTTHTREASEQYPYISSDVWLLSLTEEQRSGPGPTPAYITIHLWNDNSINQETYILPDFSSDDLNEFVAFLDRHSGHWSQSVHERQARWIEVISKHSWNGKLVPFIKLLSKSLSFSAGVFMTPGHVGFGLITGSPVPCSGLVDYGHVAHIRLEYKAHSADMFLSNDNDVLTICVKLEADVLDGTSDIPEDTESLNENNAALVVWKCLLTLTALQRAIAHMCKAEEFVALWSPSLDPLALQRRAEMETRQRGTFTKQLVDICAGLLKPQGDLASGTRKWLTPDTRSWLTTICRYSAEAAQIIDHYMRQICDELEHQKLAADKEANRIAAEQAGISAKQSQSAVILNIILAILTAATIACLPFSMTVGYFGMNTFDKNSSSVLKFWIIIIITMLILIILGIIIITIAVKYGQKIHDKVTTLLGTVKKEAIEP